MTDQRNPETTTVGFSDLSKTVIASIALAILAAFGLGGTGALTSYDLATNTSARPNAWGKTDAVEQESRIKSWVIDQLNARITPVSDSITVILGQLNSFHDEHKGIVNQNAKIIERMSQQEARCTIVTARDDELARRISDVNLSLKMDIDRVRQEMYRHIDGKLNPKAKEVHNGDGN